LLSVPLQALTERIERALKVQVDPRWIPTLIAMADGLFMHPDAVARGAALVASVVAADSDRVARQVGDVLELLTRQNILERLSVEDLYRADRLGELSHPRVWELNGWWENLYGIIPARSEWDEEEDLDIWDDGPIGLPVGKTSLPMGVSPERDDIRVLLERKILSQYEFLFRLRLSWHR